MSFQIRGIDPAPFSPLFDLDAEALLARGARRVTADAPDAYPCRISLERAPEGAELLLVHHAHQTVATSPYRAAGPVFVSRANAPAQYRAELAPIMRDRLLSLRAYDGDGLMVDAEVGENGAVLDLIRRFLDDPAVAYVHAHFARRGCFAARIDRDGP
jgi:hypothetical protein